jgi:2-isopropylmalate synthase
LYSVNAITSGSTESQGEVTVRLQHGGRVVNGVRCGPGHRPWPRPRPTCPR